MGLNTDHIKSIAGILKLLGICTAIIATSLGLAAYFISPYNKSCLNSEPFPNVDSHKVTDITVVPTRSTTTPPTRSTTSGGPPTTVDPSSDPNYDWAPVLWMEKFHVTVTFSAWIISAILLLIYLKKVDIEYSHIFKGINFVFHFLWTILLVVSAIFMAFATKEIDEKICQVHGLVEGLSKDCQLYITKMSAAAMAFLTAILYAALSFQILGKKLYETV